MALLAKPIGCEDSGEAASRPDGGNANSGYGSTLGSVEPSTASSDDAVGYEAG